MLQFFFLSSSFRLLLMLSVSFRLRRYATKDDDVPFFRFLNLSDLSPFLSFVQRNT